MNEKAPGSGALKSWLATAALVRLIICCLVAPAKTHSLRLRYWGSSVRAAGGLKQFGARSLGFQNSGSSKPAAHERSTKQTKPFFPFTAVSYPRLPSTSTRASPEMDGGEALRASAISSSRLAMRYCSTGAISGYGVLGACDCAKPLQLHAARAVGARIPTALR